MGRCWWRRIRRRPNNCLHLCLRDGRFSASALADLAEIPQSLLGKTGSPFGYAGWRDADLCGDSVGGHTICGKDKSFGSLDLSMRGSLRLRDRKQYFTLTVRHRQGGGWSSHAPTYHNYHLIAEHYLLPGEDRAGSWRLVVAVVRRLRLANGGPRAQCCGSWTSRSFGYGDPATDDRAAVAAAGLGRRSFGFGDRGIEGLDETRRPTHRGTATSEAALRSLPLRTKFPRDERLSQKAVQRFSP